MTLRISESEPETASGMDDLIAFVNARLGEDDYWANVDGGQPRKQREVEAKRKRLASYSAARAAADRYDDQYMAGVASGLADAIKDDSAVWSDHPDYKAEWTIS